MSSSSSSSSSRGVHVQGTLCEKKLSWLGLTSNGDASLTMRLRNVLFNPLSLRRVGRRDQIAKCFTRQHTVAPPGTQLSTFAWLLDWEKLRGQADRLNTRVFCKSYVRRVCNPLAEHKGRMAAVRLVRGDVDLLVVVACMWPERKRDRRQQLYLDYIISNGLADGSAKGVAPC